MNRLNPFRMSFFGAAQRCGGGLCAKRPSLPKIGQIYPTMMKVGSYALPIEHPKNV